MKPLAFGIQSYVHERAYLQQQPLHPPTWVVEEIVIISSLYKQFGIMLAIQRKEDLVSIHNVSILCDEDIEP